VDLPYALYDALAGINVPHEKARAVGDALERDMTTTLAIKPELQLLRTEMHQEFALVRKDLEAIRRDMGIVEMKISHNLTVRLGSMMVVGMGLLFGALKLT
jgi:hypothetical protein